MLEKTTTEVAVPVAGFRLVSSEVHDLTPDVVKEFRAIEPTATERELSERRVTHLSDKADKGLLVTFHWVTAALNGKVRRMNGFHSSTMLARRCMTEDGRIIAPTEKWPQGLKVHREHFEVDSGESLALLFRQFDDRVSARSSLDVSGVYQGLHPELDSVNRKIAKLAVDGYAWYQRFVEKVPAPLGDDVYGAFNDKTLYPLIQWIGTLFAQKSKEMKYPAIVAAIVGTYMINEGAARAFWQDVVSLPNGEDESTPQTVLSNWLINIQAQKIERPSPANLYQGCVWCWNAYRVGKNINTVRDEIRKNFFTIAE